MKDVVGNLTKVTNRRFIIMHATYIIASAGQTDEFHEVARNIFVQMNNSSAAEVGIKKESNNIIIDFVSCYINRMNQLDLIKYQKK